MDLGVGNMGLIFFEDALRISFFIKVFMEIGCFTEQLRVFTLVGSIIT